MSRVYFKLLIPFIKCKVPSDDEATQIVERVIAKFDNSIDFDAELVKVNNAIVLRAAIARQMVWTHLEAEMPCAICSML